MDKLLDSLNNLLHTSYIVWCLMAIIIFAVTQLIKLPIKHFTKKISNDRKRKIVNSIILLIPFGLGVLLDFLYSTYYLHETFNVVIGLGYGSAGISLYSIIERTFKVKINNPYDTEEGKAVIHLVDEIVKDGKVDSNDKSAVEEFLKKYKQ